MKRNGYPSGMGKGLTRRDIVKTLGAGSLAVAGAPLINSFGMYSEAIAAGEKPFAGQNLVVTAYGGTWSEFMMSHQIPEFEEMTGATVEIAQGQSSTWFARMQAAGKDNPPFDVWVNAETNTAALRQQGFFVPLPEDKIPNLALVLPELRREDGVGVFGLVSPLGIAYRTDKIEKPQSWLGLAKYDAQSGILASTNGGGPQQVLKFAEIVSGDYKNWQAGLDWMSKNIRNAKQVGFGAEMGPLLTQGEVVVAYLSSGDFAQLKKAGVPVDFIEPTEGWGGMYEQDMCVTAGSQVKDLGFAFINHYLSTEIQNHWANNYYLFPANKDAVINEDAKPLVPVSQDSINRIPRWDYDWLNSGHYQEILAAWNASMAR